MSTIDEVRTKPLRVVVVDDTEDIRVLLRIQFQQDRRFEVVGEAGDGREAIAVAEAEQPDLMILDLCMPVLGGLDAIPEIRIRSPKTAIVIYTAQGDPRSYPAALDAGALEMLEKVAPGRGFVERLVSALTQYEDEERTMEVRVGPVSAAAARVWIENTTKIIDAVASRPDVLGAEIPDDVIDVFRSFLAQWHAIAESTDQFRWV